MAKSKSKPTKKTKAPGSKKRPVAKQTKAANKNVKKPSKKKAAKKRKRGNDLECFLTTACVKYYALPDNCYELNTLRNYRDTFLASTPRGKTLIDQYYQVAPKIVRLTEKDPHQEAVYRYIYTSVKTACSQIEKNHLKAAKKTYISLVTTLMHKYSLTQ